MATKKWMVPLALAFAGAACGSNEVDTTQPAAEKGSLDISSITADGKGDIGRKAKVLDQIAPDSRVEGTFDSRIRVYGYVVEASRGATLNVSLEAFAGADAHSLNEGDELDTIMAVYGPYESRREPGELLIEVDDTDDSLVAPPVSIDVKEDGRYMVAFASWDDTGAGEYAFNVDCEGTDYQCRRPDFEKPCEPGQLFIQGTTGLDLDTTWKTCEVILLENTIVGPDAILTIAPGVEVKSNFLSTNGGGGTFGLVGLDVHGTLQAVGTKENPIRFTSLTDSGWRGLTLRGASNTIQHAYIDNAGTGVELDSGASGEIQDVVIEGLINGVDGNSRGRDGILAHEASSVLFKRALIKNFSYSGFRSLGGDQVVIEDSVIRDNEAGIRIEGANATSRCTTPRPPAVWRDPVIRHTDIYSNRWGVFVNGSDDLLQIEFSNIVDNEREALLIQGSVLHAESYLRNTNILRNGQGDIQVRSYHRNGILDISQNYWEDISDPALSANWNSQCNGELTFTGFHPLPLDEAGPRLDTLIDDVKQECLAVKQQDDDTDND